MKSTVKGLILKGVIKAVKQRKGEKGLKKLEKKFGGNIDFSAVKNYPTEMNARLRQAASEVIFGKYDDEAEYEFGKITFKNYQNSIIGKTMFSLLGDDLKKVALGLPKILGTINAGLDVMVNDLGARHIKIRMKNNPYHIRYHEGVWAAAIEHYGFEPKIKATVLSPNDYEYVLKW